MSARAATMSSYQRFVLALLAFLQFTVVLDFAIMAPLGAQLMPALHVTPRQFSLAVSAYAFSAATSGLLAASVADRFDRKRFLLFFYGGFVLGTLLCGLARTYEMLLVARVVTGLFGGVIGSVVSTITTDLFPLDMRGRVMGVVQTAFAASRVLGIPAGLYFTHRWDWHAPFIGIVVAALLIGAVIVFRLRPITQHLDASAPKRAPLAQLKTTLTTTRYLPAFGTTALLTTGGFMLVPFGSAFAVHSIGIDLKDLPLVYFVAGACSMVTGPWVGRIADRVGQFPVFVVGVVVAIAFVLLYSQLGMTALPLFILVNSLMFVALGATMIPSQALITAVPSADSRGAFMSVSASIQQMSGGIASVVAGLVVSEATDGHIVHFERLGYVVACTSLVTLVLMSRVRRLVEEGGTRTRSALVLKKAKS